MSLTHLILEITVFDWLQVDLARCFSPGDVILARVISFGDNQTSFLLSTAEVVVVVVFEFLNYLK